MTITELLAKRANIISQARTAMDADKAANGGQLSVEGRETVARMQAEAEAIMDEVRLIEAEADVEARAAADAASLAEAQRAFTASPEQRNDPNAGTDDNDRAFERWLRGDMTVFGGVTEVGFRSRRNAPATLFEARGDAEFRALSIGADPAGGNTVPTPFREYLYDFRSTYSTFRALGPEVLTTDSGAPFEIPTVNSQGIAMVQSGARPNRGLPENTAITGTDPAFAKITLGAHKAGQTVELSNELLQDSGVDIEAFVAKDLGRALGRREDEWFWVGSNNGEPQGVTNGGFPTINASGTDVIDYEDLTRLMGSLDQSYGNLGVHTSQPADGSAMPALKWAMNPSTLVAVWNIQDGDGRYLFQPMLTAGMSDTIFGYGVVTSTHLPEIPAAAAAATVMYFGAWQDAYILREAGMVTIRYSDEAKFLEDARAYRATCRVDAKVRDTRAVRGLVVPSA